MRLSLSALAIAAVLAAPAALAQSAASAAPAASAKDSNPVVAVVGPYKIHMSDLQTDLQSAPAQAQQLPPDQLYQMLLSQEVDRKAVLVAALKEGLQKDPTIAQQMQDAANIKLENAYVQRQVLTQVSDAAVQAAYNKQYANKPGPEQVQAKQILVQTEQQAKDHHPAEPGRRFRDAGAEGQHRPGCEEWRRTGLVQPDRDGAGLRQCRVRPEAG